MATEKKAPARIELLKIARKHQKRVMALGLRFHTSPTLPFIPPPAATTVAAGTPVKITKFALDHKPATPPVLSTSPTSTITPSIPIPSSVSSLSLSAAPKQLLLAQDAFSDLIMQLERDSEMTHMVTSDDLSRLKTCNQALLAAAYHSLFMATKMSCTSEESSWIGAGLGSAKAGTGAGAGTNRNTFMERDWANGRLYYEAHYIFRLGLEDMAAFMKSEPSTIKLFASFEQPFKELKLESEAHLK